MFSSFKKDIITKKLTKEKNIIINKSKVDNNDSLAIHKNLEKLISEFYDKKFYEKSGLTYNDLINRRNRITKSQPPVKRVVCTRAISPCYRPASKGAGFHFSLKPIAFVSFANPLKGVCITY